MPRRRLLGFRAFGQAWLLQPRIAAPTCSASGRKSADPTTRADVAARAATANANFSVANTLHDQIVHEGFRVTISDEGVMTVGNVTSAEFEKRVVKIIADRTAARAAKNWAESDRLRDELADLGVAIKDNKDGTTSWEPKPRVEAMSASLFAPISRPTQNAAPRSFARASRNWRPKTITKSSARPGQRAPTTSRRSPPVSPGPSPSSP